MASDKVIIQQILAGKRDAFAELVQRYEPLVQGAVRQRLRGADEVEDLVQEVFCKAYQQLPRLRDLDRFGPWLARMAANTALDWIRHRCFVDSEGTTQRVAELYVDGRQADAALEREEERAALWAALDRLAPELRKVVVLHHIEGCSQREIARFLGIALPTLRWRLYRARAKLGEDLQAFFPETAPTRTSARERILALLPLGPLWRPVPRPSAFWRRWSALPLGGTGLGLLLGLGVWHGGESLDRQSEQAPVYSKYAPRTLPELSVSWQPAKPRRGDKVQLTVAGLAAEEDVVLHYIARPAFARDKTVPMRRQGDAWVADLKVPPGASTIFFYPAAGQEAAPDFVAAVSPLQRQRLFERYQWHFSLVDRRGVPVRGAGYTRAQMAREQGRSHGEVLAYLNKEIRRHPDHAVARRLRDWTLAKEARLSGDKKELAAPVVGGAGGVGAGGAREPMHRDAGFASRTTDWRGGPSNDPVGPLLFTGRFAAAQTRLRQLVQRQWDDPFVGPEQVAETFEHLGRVAERLDDRQAAIAAYGEAAVLAGSASANAALERLGQAAPAAMAAKAFRLPAADGGAVQLAAYRGRPVLLAYGGLGGLMPGVLDSLEILQEKFDVEVLCVDGGYGEGGAMSTGTGRYAFTFARDDGQVYGAFRPAHMGSLFLIDARGLVRLRRDFSRRIGGPVLLETAACFSPVEERLEAWRRLGALSG